MIVLHKLLSCYFSVVINKLLSCCSLVENRMALLDLYGSIHVFL
jgi:hypothetical protein